MTRTALLGGVVCAALAVVWANPAAAQTSPPTVTFSASTATVGEGDGAVVVHLDRSGDLSGFSSVQLQPVYYSTATNGSDFGPVAQTVIFNPFEAAKNVSIPIIEDSVYEGDESFTLMLSASMNASIDFPAAITVTIADNEPASLVGFGQGAYAVSEHDGSANVTVVRSGVTSVTTTVTYAAGVNYGSTATPNGDFVPVSGTLTFAPGETSRIISIPIVDDALPEAVETFTVSLLVVTNGARLAETATVTISDDDIAATLAFASINYTIGEGGGTVTLTVVRGRNTAIPVTVYYATDQGFCYNGCTATSSQDYLATSGTLTFAPGEISKSFSIPIFDDLTAEPDERFMVTLSNPTNATLPPPGPGQFQYVAIVTINDNDSDTKLAFAPATYQIAESGGITNVIVVRSGVTTGTTTASFSTQNGTAVARADFTIATGMLTFAPGETSKSIPVPILDDNLAEGDEAFSMTLSAAGALITAGTATIKIIDDEQQSFVGFTPAAVSVQENAGSVTLQVQRTGPAVATATVGYVLDNTCCQTAVNGSDFTLIPGTVSFGPGETLKSITIPIIDDTITENDELFSVSLTSPTNAVLGAATTSVTIVNDDAPTSYRLLNGPFVVSEGAGSITIAMLREGNVAVASSIPYTTQPFCCASGPGIATPGADYLPVDGTLEFAAGETQKTITIPIVQDNLTEGDETFRLVIGTSYISQFDATITIRDDEAQPEITAADVSVAEGNSGLTPVMVTLRLSAPLQRTLAIRYGTASGSTYGSATFPSDYLGVNGTVTFNPGETTKSVPISVVGDTIDEGDEFFTLLFQYDYYAGNAVPRLQPSARITIRNDDASFSINDVVVNEGDGGTAHATFTVKLSVALPSPVSVAYSTVGGSAQEGSDFTGVSGTLTFAPGEKS
ncbi:MAG: retention module-containing protein, partial [Acidobacteria bacterium]|nr:retention module-containing protein [Acidobacteriota bacterium]